MMGGYLVNFAVYTMAMIGLIFFALFVYKKVMEGCCSNTKSGFLQVEETMSIAPRKTLYVVRAGNERFLVASDVDKTSLISKLNENSSEIISENKSSIDELPTIVDFRRDLNPQSRHKEPKKTVILDMLQKINK